MKFIKIWFFVFLVIFFANYVFPGIEITDRTKFPHLGVDFPFAILLGLCNALIYPVIQRFNRRSPIFPIMATAFLLNFAVYGSLSLFHIGMHIDSIRYYLLIAGLVSVASIIANILEMKRNQLPPDDLIQPPHEELP